MKKYVVVTFLLLMSLLATSPAHAQSELYGDGMRQKVEIYQREMARIEAWLNNIKTMVATFSQVAPDDSRSSGTFYLSRPGKLRWEYDAPVPISIIAKGDVLAYYDKELDQVSHVSLDDTLANFLTRPEIRFNDKDIEIIGFSRDEKDTAVSIAKRGAREEGSLTLVFGNDTNELQRMEVIDPSGERTRVFFETSVLGVPLENKLFELPKFKGR